MVNQTTFSNGQIVKLKSGGPEMTVKSTASHPSNYYICQWFAGKKLEQGIFSAESLELVPSDSK